MNHAASDGLSFHIEFVRIDFKAEGDRVTLPGLPYFPIAEPRETGFSFAYCPPVPLGRMLAKYLLSHEGVNDVICLRAS